MAAPRFYFEIDGEWVEAVDEGGVYTRDGVTISRGYADENSKLKASTCHFTLKNHDLRYSVDNPMSPYFEKFGQNTPFKVTRESNVYGLWTYPGDTGGAATPDSPALSITGDLDLRAHVPVIGAIGGTGYNTVGKNSAYALRSSHTALTLAWADSGAVISQVASTVAAPPGHEALRATLDVDNGAAGHTVTFYTAPAWGDPWVQLGAAVITAGVTSVLDTAGAGLVGGTITNGAQCVGRVEIRTGIGGAVVASPDFAGQPAGTTSFADGQGNTWTVDSDSHIGYHPPFTRFVGELSSAKTKHDVSDTDHYVAAEASGISQRLGSGRSLVRTALESWVPAQTASSFRAEAYWPLNEGAGSISGKPLVGSSPISLTRSASPSSRFGRGDLKLPWLDSGVELYEGDLLHGDVVMSGAGTAWEFDFVYACQDDADMVVNLYTERDTGAGWIIRLPWDILLFPSTKQIGVTKPDGTQVLWGTGLWRFDPFDGVGRLTQLRVSPRTPSGSDINLVISSNYEGEDGLGLNGILDDGFSTSSAAHEPGRLVRFDFEHIGTPDKPFAVSHVAAFSCTGSSGIYSIEVPGAGNINEQADARMARVSQEKGVPFTTSPSYATAFMGPQKPTDYLSVMQECAAADAGLLYESRDALGLTYQPLGQLHNNGAALTLDYAAGHVAPVFEPVRDDQRVRNAVTAKRVDGGEESFEQTVGRYAVTDPVDGGVGRYDSAVTVNVANDNLVGDVAGWAVHLGTWDEPRYPTVTVNLSAPEVSEALAAQVLAVDIGDRIDITNAQVLGVYDTIQLLVVGYDEWWDEATHSITFNCVPQRPYRPLRLNASGGAAKLNSHGSELDDDVDATDTTIPVTVADAGLWTTSPGHMPITIKVGGEVMTATAISGASSPQTFTVTRSVNGVAKSHDAGTQVRLERPALLAYGKNF